MATPTTAPISGNQNFTVVSNHAAQLSELSIGSTLEATQIKTELIGEGNFDGSDVTGLEHPIILSGNPILMGDCCSEQTAAQFVITQDPEPFPVGENGGSIIIGSEAPGGPGTSGSRIGFFGVPPVPQPATVPAVPDGPGLGVPDDNATAINEIRSLLIDLGLMQP